ncbi:hypothetical protein ABZP36_030157 [Zizania latifolia]
MRGERLRLPPARPPPLPPGPETTLPQLRHGRPCLHHRRVVPLRRRFGTRVVVHIVYVSRPEGADPKEFHIRTLAAILGSEEKAKEAVLYHYKHAASGFSAKLTPQQVKELKSESSSLFFFQQL